MLDDLRNASSFSEEEEKQNQEPSEIRSQYAAQESSQTTFLGMSAAQRFILSLMIFLIVCVLGAFALVASGSVVLPF